MVEVLSREAATLGLKTDDALLYYGQLNDSLCTIRYGFERGRLVSGFYLLDSADHIDVIDFFQLKEMLDEKYGSVELLPEWRGGELDFDIHDFKALGHNVALGRLSLSAHWETPESAITLYLGDDEDAYNAHVSLLYSDRGHADQGVELRREATKAVL